MFLFLLLMRLSWFCCSLRASCGAAIPVVHGAGVRSLSPRVPAAPEFRLHPSCAVWEMFLLEETGFALLEETGFAQLEACKRGHGELQPHFCPGTQRVRAFLLAPVPGAAFRAAPWPLPPFQGREIPLLHTGSCSRPSQQQGLPAFQPLWCIRQRVLQPLPGQGCSCPALTPPRGDLSNFFSSPCGRSCCRSPRMTGRKAVGWLAASISGLEVLLRTPRGCKRRSLKWEETGGGRQGWF